jgi:hypothetical protein
MAATGFTPIQLYRTTTASAQPSAGNLADGELAINLTDKKLYAKDASNNVFVLADASSGGTTATNLAGGAAGSVPYQTGANATTFLGIGTAAQVLQVNSGATAPEWVNTSGTGDVARTTSPSFTTPSLGAATALSINSLTLTTSTGTFTLANGKTLTVNNSLTLSGTDATTMTFPSTSATIARTDAAQSFTGTQTFLSNPVLDAGTANGVLYLNGSKVVTSGSALTFDGIQLGVSGGTGLFRLNASSSDYNVVRLAVAGTNYGSFGVGTGGEFVWNANGLHLWNVNSSEQMRLTSTGLGIGNSSPTAKLDVTGTAAISGAVTLSGGTANGVAYLNGSKVVTSGSALTFDGTSLGVGTSDYGNAGSINVAVGVPATATGGLQLWSTTSGSHYMQFGDATAGDGPYRGAVGYNHTLDALQFFASGSEKMALTSTGLGIGASSPLAKLDVVGGNGDGIQYRTGTRTVGIGQIASEAAVYWGSTTALTFFSGSELMRLDSSGNLGLGVTPSAWTSYKALQVASTGGALSSSSSSDLEITTNAYYNAGWLSQGAGVDSSRYRLNAGTHAWFTAPSEPAGDPISFTQAMTLTANGNLLVGATALPSASVEGICFTGTTSGNFSSSGASTAAYNHLLFYNGNGIVGSISTTGSATTYSTSSDYRLKNITGPITTSGAYIDSLNPVEGTWKADGSTFVGLIAHEVQEASRTTVATGVKDGEQMQGMDYSSAEIIANLIAEVKALRTRVAKLEAK